MEKGRLDALFGSPTSIVIGTVATAMAVGLCYFAVRDPFLPFVAMAFGVTGIIRIAIHNAYWREMERLKHSETERMTRATLDRWRLLCIAGGTIYAAFLGMWCFQVIVSGAGEFVELTAITTALCNTVGIAGRNYSSKLYVNLQSLVVGVPLVAGLVLYGDLLHSMLAFFYTAHFFALISIAGSMRKTLDAATRDGNEVRESAGRLATAFETVPSGLLMFDAEGVLILANKEALEFLDIPGDNPLPRMTRKATGKRIMALLRLAPAEREAFRSMLHPTPANVRRPDSALLESGVEGGLVVNHRKGGTYRLATGNSADGSLMLRIDNVTEQRASQQKIVALSRFDALTGLANRSWFFNRALDYLDSPTGRPVMAAVIDVDNFKSINDTMGHSAGDAVLRRLAHNLDDMAGDDGVCGRLGGDEFIIVMRLAEDDSPERWCETLHSAVNFRMREQGRELDVRTSAGAYGLRETDRPGTENDVNAVMDAIIARADFAQYRAKADDAVTVCVYDDTMDSHLKREAMLRNDLAIAIREGKLETHYQPIVRAGSGRPKGVEALARWTHPTLGPISPGEFIPLAEQTGVIRELTAWQLHDACHACARWPEDMTVSVNLSARDFASDAIVDHIESALSQAGLASHRLTVEITETSLLKMHDAVMKLLATIRSMGVQIALDDFGTGYCSLSYLRNLPFDILKIDRAFLKGIEDDPQHLAILSTIASLARQLNKAIVIEGVETAEQLELLQGSVEFDFVQGYYFGRPLPVRDADALLGAFAPKSDVNSAEATDGGPGIQNTGQAS